MHLLDMPKIICYCQTKQQRKENLSRIGQDCVTDLVVYGSVMIDTTPTTHMELGALFPQLLHLHGPWDNVREIQLEVP